MSRPTNEDASDASEWAVAARLSKVLLSMCGPRCHSVEPGASAMPSRRAARVEVLPALRGAAVAAMSRAERLPARPTLWNAPGTPRLVGRRPAGRHTCDVMCPWLKLPRRAGQAGRGRSPAAAPRSRGRRGDARAARQGGGLPAEQGGGSAPLFPPLAGPLLSWRYSSTFG